MIVTANLAGFPADVLSPYGIEARHPDDFVARLLDADPAAVCLAAKRQRESLRNPPKTADEYLDSLRRQGLPQTVTALRPFTDLS